ncbi:hypothetical protein Nepgr_021035 [Nepenthes gracilis]|uniref:GDPGP1-like N-terminal domain-containing protein n=1 Tax=Nepenthes gracilis TaxID=150966 RepID=A0AAD3SY09_NEPGR|nr:hypothetical protein Nepgr_021035 [Nepenthes gracilis]
MSEPGDCVTESSNPSPHGGRGALPSEGGSLSDLLFLACGGIIISSSSLYQRLGGDEEAPQLKESTLAQASLSLISSVLPTPAKYMLDSGGRNSCSCGKSRQWLLYSLRCPAPSPRFVPSQFNCSSNRDSIHLPLRALRLSSFKYVLISDCWDGQELEVEEEKVDVRSSHEACAEYRIVVWFIIPADRNPHTDHNNNALALIVLLQNVPRLYQILPLNFQIVQATGVVTKTAWAGAVYNLLLYMLAGHVLGAAWNTAMLPKSQEFNWKSAIVGLIQIFSFWSYLLTQIVGSLWADKISGKLVLGFGVIGWSVDMRTGDGNVLAEASPLMPELGSVATVLASIDARINLPGLLIMRVIMGMGERVAMPTMNNIISKWIPESERSRALASIYSSMYLGFVTGLVFLPFLLHQFGWPSVFGSFESPGGAWFALWLSKAYSSPNEDSGLSGHKRIFILEGSISRTPVILSRAPVLALEFAHSCHNWEAFILPTGGPTYYNPVLKFHLMESGLVAVLPWLARVLFASIKGWTTGTRVPRGPAVTSVRKIMQSIEVLGPVFLLSLLGQMKPPILAVLSLPCRQELDAFSQSGLYSNHQDIGPCYSRVKSKAFGQLEANSGESWEPRVKLPLYGYRRMNKTTNENRLIAHDDARGPPVAFLDTLLGEVSPIEYGHVLLIPCILKWMPRRIDHGMLKLALHMAMEAGSPYFRLGYNSVHLLP